MPTAIREFIQEPTNTCFVSIASLWEISIKIGTGKLEIDTPITDLFDFLERNRFWVMPIELNHLVQLQSLPYHHRDPFDRIIIAQALAETLPVATKDQLFSQYGVITKW